jgi:phosphatidate cytidylyltransferase
MQSKTSS